MVNCLLCFGVGLSAFYLKKKEKTLYQLVSDSNCNTINSTIPPKNLQGMANNVGLTFSVGVTISGFPTMKFALLPGGQLPLVLWRWPIGLSQKKRGKKKEIKKRHYIRVYNYY